MPNYNIEQKIALRLNILPKQAAAAIKLMDEGNTIPFIARYRKEATNELLEEQLRQIEMLLKTIRNLAKRKEEIMNNLKKANQLTPVLLEKINQAAHMQELEDIYLPYKQKRHTRAEKAKAQGLLPLGKNLLAQKRLSDSPAKLAQDFLRENKIPLSLEDALQGARDIAAEHIMEMPDIRQLIRQKIWQDGQLSTKLNEKSPLAQTFLMYQNYTEALRSLPPHRILAINRGETQKALTVSIQTDHEKNIYAICQKIIRHPSPYSTELTAAITDGYKRLLLPALSRDIRRTLTDKAAQHSIRIFSKNLQQLLLQPPIAGCTVMGLDPGYRTGCKMAIVDPTGQILAHGVFHLTSTQSAREKAKNEFLQLVKDFSVNLVSIGNGTASYETETFVAESIKEFHLPLKYIITNEAGASVYSASALAVKELPDYDVTIRGAVSIARRIQDPLAELVKIEPQAIGIGQYQHDVNAKELALSLDAVVESVVNQVGVDLNTASAALLQHIAGMTQATAHNIVNHREANGRFSNRTELLRVSRLGQVAYTQCAGFLRISDGSCALDNTSVHPESYSLAEKILCSLDLTTQDIANKKNLPILQEKLSKLSPQAIATKLQAGLPTIRDIISALMQPGRDPRATLPAPLTRKNLLHIADLHLGTILRGTIRNITDFGAFVDIGLKKTGLVHISELSHHHIKHPLDIVSIGDIINVKVISIDEERERIGLSLKQTIQEGEIA